MSFNDKGLPRKIKLEITLEKNWHRKMTISAMCNIVSQWGGGERARGNYAINEKKGRKDGPVGQLLSIFRVIDMFQQTIFMNEILQ